MTKIADEYTAIRERMEEIEREKKQAEYEKAYRLIEIDSLMQNCPPSLAPPSNGGIFGKMKRGK